MNEKRRAKPHLADFLLVQAQGVWDSGADIIVGWFEVLSFVRLTMRSKFSWRTPLASQTSPRPTIQNEWLWQLPNDYGCTRCDFSWNNLVILQSCVFHGFGWLHLPYLVESMWLHCVLNLEILFATNLKQRAGSKQWFFD